MPPELCRLIIESGAEYVVIALRINAIKDAPGYQKYLQAFRGEGFVIKQVIQLGRRDRLPEVEISNHHDGLLPNNQVAAAITNMIGFF